MNSPRPDPMPTLDSYAAKWLEQSAFRLRPNTIVGYRCVLAKHVLPRIGGKSIETISSADVRGVLTEMLRSGYVRSTVQMTLGAISSMFGDAVHVDRLITINPAHGASQRLWGPRPKRMPRTFSAAHLDDVFAALDDLAPHHVDLFRLMSRTALRIGEALALRRSAINLTEGWILVEGTWHGRGRRVGPPKSESSHRYIDASPEATEILHRRLAQTSSGWLFENDGAPYHQRTPQQFFQKSVARAGLPRHYSPHCLRHTWATAMLLAGAPAEYVQQQLGHCSVKITIDTYASWERARRPEFSATADEILAGRRTVKTHRPLAQAASLSAKLTA